MGHSVPTLSSRLMAAALFVKPGRTVADIGTDHAFLPCYLAAKSICPRAVAADLREGPLARARRTIQRLDLDDRIKPVLSDGLDNISPADAEEIVLCGMGGELMADILSRAEWIKSGAHALILQPMSAIDELRKWLFENGFAVKRETLADEGRCIYYIMRAEKGETGAYEPYELVFGKGLSPSPAACEYLNRLIRRYGNIAGKAGRSSREDSKKRAEKAKDILDGLYVLRGKWRGLDVCQGFGHFGVFGGRSTGRVE